MTTTGLGFHTTRLMLTVPSGDGQMETKQLVCHILGQMGNQSITADEMASELGTIPYEILTGLNQRIPRVYHPLKK